MKKVFFLVSILLLITSCTTVTYQQGLEYEKGGKKDEALSVFRKVAKKRQGLVAVKAQSAVIRLLTQRGAWQDILREVGELTSFLDPEDPWYQQYRHQPKTWNSAQQEIVHTLITCSREAHRSARKHGSPNAYIVMGRLYGLYLERFPGGKLRGEAALGRGMVFAIRTGCPDALPWFKRAKGWTKAYIKGKPVPKADIAHAQTRPLLSEKAVYLASSRSALGCRVDRWQREWIKKLQGQNDKDSEGSKETPLVFADLYKETQELLKDDARNGPIMVLRWALKLRKSAAFVQSLKLFLLMIQKAPKHPVTGMARKSSLELFGMTRTWKPLLQPLQAALLEVPKAERGTLFWRRVQELVILHGLRQARGMLKQKKGDLAIERLIKIYHASPENPKAILALYQAALAVEESKTPGKAITFYKTLFTKHPKHQLADRALFRYAKLLQKTKPLTAAKWFVRLSLRYRKSIVCPRALYEAYVLYRQARYHGRARWVRRQLRLRYPLSMEAKKLGIRKRSRRGRRRRGRRRRR